MGRDYGTGSVTFRGTNRWQLRWYDGIDPITGRHRRKSKTFHGAKKDALRELALLTSSGKSSGAVPLGALIDRWLDGGSHADSTLRNYRRSIKLVPPLLAKTAIDELRVSTLDAFYAQLDAQGVSRHRIVNLAAVISGALQQAVTWEWLPTNVGRLAKVPQPEARDGDAPEVEHVRALFRAVADNPQRVAWLALTVITGARRGEIVALQWRDVDLDAGGLNIRHALDPNTGTLKDTKTKASRRALALDPVTVDVLSVWKDAAAERARAVGARLNPTAFVLSDAPDSMRPWRPDVATKRFIRLRRTAGVPDTVRLYDLRHAAATLLLAGGHDPKTVAGRLGHSRVGTTTDTYGHVIPARDQAAALALRQIIDS